MTERSWTYGLQLPIQALSRTIANPWEHDASVADLVTVAARAEATGHDFVGVCDHVAIPDNDYAAHMSTTWYDTVATLGYLAARTSRVRLLSVVWVAPYRHPLQTAKSFATLDHLSGGRVILGVGAGHVQAEFEALGVDYTRRGRILDEVLAAVRGAFDDTYVSFSGAKYRYERVGVGPRPVRGAFPIWVGGSGEAAWRRAGRYGDGYIPMGAPASDYPRIIECIRASAADAGRDGAAIAIGFMPGGSYLTGPLPEGVTGARYVGAEPLAEAIRGGRAAGADVIHVAFRSRSLDEYLDQLDAFAEEVVPLVD